MIWNYNPFFIVSASLSYVFLNWTSYVLPTLFLGQGCSFLVLLCNRTKIGMMIEWVLLLSYPLCLGSSSCFFTHFPLYVCSAAIAFFCQISPLLSSPLFCRWWNCLSPYRTCEEIGIITSRPYITFSSILCYDALMLQVHDQMMIDMFLRPLLLLLLVFWYIIVL